MKVVLEGILTAFSSKTDWKENGSGRQMISEKHGIAIIELKSSEIIRDNDSTDSEEIKRSNIIVWDKKTLR